MQSRRSEGFRTQSPPLSKMQYKYEMGRDRYPVHRDDEVSVRPRYVRRSVSPDGSRRVFVGDWNNRSVGGRGLGLGLGRGRGQGWDLGEGRTEKVLPGSSSSSYGQHRRRMTHYDDEMVPRNHRYVEQADIDDINGSRLRNVYDYDNDDDAVRMTREKDYSDGRMAATNRHGIMSQQQRLPVEGGVMRGSYRSRQDMVSVSEYDENSARLPPSSQNVDMGHLEYERRHYRESVPVDNIAVMQLYKEGEKHKFHRRDDSYSMASSAPHPIDVSRSSAFKNYSVTSSGISSKGHLASYQDDVSLPASDEYMRNDRNLTEPTGINVYGKRPHIITERDLETRPRNIMHHRQGSYSLYKTKSDDIRYPRQKVQANDDSEYLPVHSYFSKQMMPLHTCRGYDDTLIDHNQIDLSRPKIGHPVVGRLDDPEGSSGNQRKSTSWDYSSLQKQTGLEYVDMRVSYATKLPDEHLGSKYSYGKKVSHGCEVSPVEVPSKHQIPHSRPDYDLQRDASPEFQGVRMQNHRLSIHDPEIHRFALRPQKSKDGHDAYEPSDNVFQRKYVMDDNLDQQNSGISISRQCNVPPEYGDLYDTDEEWVDEDMNGLNLSRTGAFNHKQSRNAGRVYDDGHHSRDSASDDWPASRDSFAPGQAVRFYKNSGRYIKHTVRPAAYDWHKQPHVHRRFGMHKHHKVWERNDEYDNSAYVNDDNQSEEWGNMGEPEPSEDSEEFKQMVDDAFLKYSKRINANSAVQRRYKEQGKSGSLFCVACGRSNSKEFIDTQRLVTHAFKSHKVGLRAKHLGLHKAICVLLGWNTVAPVNTITWSPEVLPEVEASTQKEDLILWPPVVVIHNISMSNNDPMVQKVVPIEGIQALLREKGFVGGKIKVCLGKPADQSVILVKFLGTFTGFGMTEKLHNYFAENKHGRTEFEQNKSVGRSIANQEAGTQEDQVEQLLYGYMGIAEDLDRLDFNSKKFTIIKSKKEILDLANAPVRPDDS